MRGDAMRSRYLVVVLALTAILGVACGGGDDADSEETAAGGSGGGGGGGSSTVTLTAAEFAFDPTDLSASAGSTIEFTNEDDAEHNFTVKDLDIDEDVDPKGSTTIDLGDAEAGSYDFFCEYHPDMKGSLEVTG